MTRPTIVHQVQKPIGACKMMGIDFKDLRVGRMFHYNGNDYFKQSSRTARLLAYDRVFYFRMNDYVHPVAW